jgi:ubiquitin C-terminal hydrolase
METDSKKRVLFWDFPDVLFIQFKRFKQNNDNIIKIAEQIEYPEKLNLSKYLSSYNYKQINYQLTNVIHHFGSYNSGHYTSSCLIDNNWYYFDDSTVRKIEHENVQSEIMNSSSYIIVYTKIN